MDPRTLVADIRWVLRREGARLKWRGLIGLALGVAAIGFALTVVMPRNRSVLALKEDVASLRTRLKATGESGAAAQVAPTRAVQLENFYAFFPAPATLPDWIGQIHNAAQRNGLTLESGEYQLQQSAKERLLRYQIRLPVKGTYPQLRSFVSEVLEKVPALALEDAVVKRDGIGNPQLEARFTFTLFLGAGT